ncbi:hypothetical protein Pmar_PMAR009015, partial [Perkinsus marinus ATCC 50983]
DSVEVEQSTDSSGRTGFDQSRLDYFQWKSLHKGGSKRSVVVVELIEQQQSIIFGEEAVAGVSCGD